MWRAKVVRLLGAVLFLIGCADHQASTLAPTEPAVAGITPEVVVTVERAPDGFSEDGYWNGGQWSDMPVYSLQLGISQTAHDHFRACGAGDEQIEELVSYHLERAADAITLSSQMSVQAGEPGSTPAFTRMMRIERLVPGVYVVTCEVE